MRNQKFTFLCSKEERLSLERLAAIYRRTKGDTVRLLIQQAFQEAFKDIDPPAKNKRSGKESRHGKDAGN